MPQFSAANSLGSRAPEQISSYLTDIGDLEGAKAFMLAATSGQSTTLFNNCYAQAGFMLGYIPPAAASQKLLPIVGISEIAADKSLIGRCIKITLDKFHVHSYPGLGNHNILCEFSGKNQVAGESEELKFAMRFKCSDQASAAIAAAPIFLGITVGKDGISFEGRTVNVSSDLDDTILSTLDGVAFKSGLTLLSTAQPALRPFASLASAAVAATASRKKNAQVHCFNIGLDFADGATSARLRHGSYVVVQTNSTQWKWDDFQWNSDARSLERKAGGAPIDFNYLIVGVTEFTGTDAARATA